MSEEHDYPDAGISSWATQAMYGERRSDDHAPITQAWFDGEFGARRGMLNCSEQVSIYVTTNGLPRMITQSLARVPEIVSVMFPHFENRGQVRRLVAALGGPATQKGDEQ